MDVIYFIKALLKRKWWIMISTVVALALSFLFTMDKAKLYKSNSQMSTGFTVNDDVKLKDENVNLYEADVKFNNVVETFNSPSVIGLLGYDLMLHDLTSPKPFTVLTDKQRHTPEFTSFNRAQALTILQHKLDSLQTLTSYQPEERKLLEYMALYKYDYESVKERLWVGRLARTDYIDISFGSENPELSAYAVNQIIKVFLRYYRSLRSERSVENIGTFEELVAQKKTELDQKVEALRNYKSSEGLLNVEAASGNELGLISQFERALLDEKGNLNIINSSLQTVNSQLGQMGQGQVIYDNNNDIVSLRRQINQMNDEYMRTGSTDAALSDKIKTSRQQLQKLMSAAPTTTTASKTLSREELLQRKAQLEGDQRAAMLNISNLQAKIGSLRGSVGTYANKEANVKSMQQELDLAQEEYNKLKEKLNTALDSRTAASDNFRQTLQGQPAFRPESTKRMKIMGLAGMSVFLLSTLGVLFLEFFDRSIKSPSLFEKNVDLKLISTINHADLQRYSIPQVLQAKAGGDDLSIKRQNTFRELLRKLRFEVESSNKSIFLFTSTEAQQGKTTLVQALAYSLSLSNKRVLIIDTNFCNNDLTMQLEAKPTLETFSLRPEEVSLEKVREIVTTYSVEGIEVIGCKGGDYTPSEILPRHHLLNYLPQLKTYYDYVLLEGAPLNDFTDSKELVAYVDSVIAVFSSRLSMKQNDKESIQFLQSLNGKMLGAVLNNVSEDYLEL
jgi:polysaccharide biosynthesis transport protein